MAGRAGRLARVRVSGSPVAFTGEATSVITANTVYQITDATKRVWDRTATITVKKGGVSQSATLYTLNRLTGTVTFLADQGGAAVITVDGSYLPLSEAATAHRYTHTRSRTTPNDTAFGATWESLQPGMARIAGSLGRWVIDAFFADALTTGAPVVIEFMSDRNQAQFLRAWALLSTEQMESAVDGVSDESVAFVGAADVDNRVVSS